MGLKPLLSFAIVLAAGLSSAGRVPMEWQFRYDALSKVITSRNFQAFKTYLAPNYTWVTPEGKSKNRKQALAEFAVIFKMKKITGREVVTKFRKKGDAYNVSYESKWTLVSQKDKTSHFHEIGVDSWRQVKGTWQIFRTVDSVSEAK